MRAKFNSFIITATYTGSKCAPWGNGRENWNHHTVTVRNTATGKKTSFDFWASIANPELSSEYDRTGEKVLFPAECQKGFTFTGQF